MCRVRSFIQNLQLETSTVWRVVGGMEDLDRMLDKPHDLSTMSRRTFFNPEFYRPDGVVKAWLRIPINAFEWPPLTPDRVSFYAGRETTTYVTGFHRTRAEAMVGRSSCAIGRQGLP